MLPSNKWLGACALLVFLHLIAPAQHPELVVQTSHTELITSTAFSHDGKFLASGSKDNTIKLWEVATGRQLYTWRLPSPVQSIAFNPDGRLLAGGSDDCIVRVWEVRTGAELWQLKGHTASVRGLIFSPDNKLLVSGGWDGTTKLWPLVYDSAGAVGIGQKFRVTAVRAGTEAQQAGLSTGALITAADGLTFGSSADLGAYMQPRQDYVLTVRDGAGERSLLLKKRTYGADLNEASGLAFVPLGLEAATLKTGAKFVESVAFSPDGGWLASAGLGAKEAPAVNLWRTHAGTREGQKLDGLAGDFDVVAFSPDNATLAGGSRDGTVKLWAVKTGRELTSLRGTEPVESLAFSPDGRLLASCSGSSTNVWDIQAGKIIRRLPGYSLSVAFEPTGRTLATSSGGVVNLWEVETGRLVRQLFGHSRFVNAVAYSDAPGSAPLLATGGGQIKLWDLSSGQPRDTPGMQEEPVDALAFSHDAKLLARAGFDSAIKLWDVELGRERLTLKGHASPVQALAFSHAGRVLASASGGMSLDNLLAQRAETLTADNTVRLWNADTGSQLRALTGHTEQVNAVAFSPDDKLVASGSNDGTVKLWAADTGAELRTLEWSIGTVLAVAFSPDGKVLASGHSNYILLWDVSTGRLLKRLDGHMPRGRAAAAEELFTTELVTSGLSAPACGSTDFRWVTSLSFSHDGKTLASGSKDRTAKLWDARTGALLHTLSGHDSWVTSVAFSPDDRMLASGSADTQVKMWNVASGREQISLVNIDRRDWIVVTPDGLFDGSPAAWNQLLWRFGRNNYDVRPVEIFFNEFYYPSLLAEVSAGRRPSAGQTILQKDRRQPEVKLSLAAGQVMPAEGLATRNLTVRVEVREAATDPAHAAGSGARDLRLFRNGALVRVWRGALELRDGKAVLETTLPIVAGENRLSAYAFNNDNIKSSDAALTVKGADALKRKGTAYILAIGINKYASNRRFLNLNYAVADALDFGAVLKQQEATVGNFERIEVLTLLDANATKARLLAALGQLVARAEPEDELVIFFAGHGKADGQRFFMLPHDIAVRQAGLGRAPAALPSVLARSISDRELELALEKVDVGHLLLVIDACNSGQALNADEQRRGPMNSKGLAQLAYEKGMYILTASQSYQEAAETRAQKHGLLTYALTVEGLTAGRADDAPRDGQILLREWLDYATKRVPELRAAENVELLRRQGRRRGLLLQSVAGEASPQQRARQQPRVFYRRELEDKPLVIARLAAPPEP